MTLTRIKLDQNHSEIGMCSHIL